MWLVLYGSIRVLLDTKFRRLPVVDVSGKLVSISMIIHTLSTRLKIVFLVFMV